MMAVRCRTSLTSTSMLISKKSAARLVNFRLEMLPSLAPIRVVMAPRVPGSLATTTSMRPTYGPSASPSTDHATSSQRSGVSSNCCRVSQSMVWTVRPSPEVTMPTMRSPGSGWQHSAKWTAMPGISPRIGMAAPAGDWPSASARREAALAPTAAGKAAPTACRAAISPRPTAACRSSPPFRPSALAARFSAVSVMLRRAWTKPRSSMALPSLTCSSRSRMRTKRRMRERALPVATNCAQVGLGAAVPAVMISTWSPFWSTVRNWLILPSIFVPTQRSPISVWTA